MEVSFKYHLANTQSDYLYLPKKFILLILFEVCDGFQDVYHHVPAINHLPDLMK